MSRRAERSRPRGRDGGRDRGAVMVEFAIGGLLLAILVFGTIDIGRAFITWNQTKSAAREGGAYAERDPWSQSPSGGGCTDPDNIVYRAQTENGAKRTDLVVTTSRNGVAYSGCRTPATFTINPGDEITVTVSKTFTPISPIGSFLFGSPTISASAQVVVQ